MIKYLLFDLDGTLFDYQKSAEEALRRVCDYIDATTENKDFISDYEKINLSYWKKFEKGLISVEALSVARFEELSKKYEFYKSPKFVSEKYVEFLSEICPLVEGAENLMNKVKDDFVLGIVTNGVKKVQIPRLKNSGFSQYFADSMITISEDVGKAKPHKLVFEVCREKFGNPPKDEILIIGDNLISDIDGGNDYGIKTCWFNQFGTIAGASKPDYTINKLMDLLPLIKRKK